MIYVLLVMLIVVLVFGVACRWAWHYGDDAEYQERPVGVDWLRE